jgi:toxin-antitoxin system PIN domain toxin
VVALLDVNVLVALFDPMHVHHEAAHAWFDRNRKQGWATCPLTETGFVRVVSNPSYPGRRTTPQDAVNRLEQFRLSGYHHFWADSVTIRDQKLFRYEHILGHQQLADVYLLALAVQNHGRLATFDRSIRRSSVADARAEQLALVSE